jgi:hypothetical protein
MTCRRTPDLQEDTAELIISTTSFSRMDWVCLGCETGHKLLPKKRNKGQWTKGRKLVILTDQNMPASLPSKDDLCPAIIRVENGLLCELGDLFFSLLKDFTLPEGNVLLIGSLTHLMEEGLVGYAKKLGAEFRHFSKLFDYTVHVVPFLPPPLGGTNDPDLVSNSYHIMTWLEHVQKWNLTGYYNMLRHFLATNQRRRGGVPATEDPVPADAGLLRALWRLCPYVPPHPRLRQLFVQDVR